MHLFSSPDTEARIGFSHTSWYLKPRSRPFLHLPSCPKAWARGQHYAPTDINATCIDAYTRVMLRRFSDATWISTCCENCGINCVIMPLQKDKYKHLTVRYIFLALFLKFFDEFYQREFPWSRQITYWVNHLPRWCFPKLTEAWSPYDERSGLHRRILDLFW